MGMMNFNGKEVAEEFQAAFGVPISSLTKPQLMVLTKIIKHCRGRCRNNAALYNYMNGNFPQARWHEETKEYNGKEYDGMVITMRS